MWLTSRFISRLFLTAVLAGLFGSPPARAAAGAGRKAILILYDEDRDLPGLSMLDRSLKSTLRAGIPGPIAFYTESMDLSRFQQNGHQQFLRDTYRRKYAGKKIDLIISVMGPSLEFLLKYGREIFHGIPILFCGIDRREIGRRKLPPNVTGVLVQREFGPTLDLALRLQPDTRRAVLISGTSGFDHRLAAQALGELRAFKDRVAITHLTNLPMRDILRSVAHLPPHTILLYLTLFRDGEGVSFIPHEAVSLIAKVSNAPVYGFVDQYLGRGIVGGHLYSLEGHGTRAAELGLRILRGEKPAAIPAVVAGANRNLFDARELDRWQIPEAQLPPGSSVQYREQSIWDRYRWRIIGAALVCLLEALLIIALLIERSIRRRAERTLADRLRFERMVSRIASGFVHLPAGALEPAMGEVVQCVAEYFDADRCILSRLTAEGEPPSVRQTCWSAAGTDGGQPSPGIDALPHAFEALTCGTTWRIRPEDRIPAGWTEERQFILDRGIRSLIWVPVLAEDAFLGSIGIESSAKAKGWAHAEAEKLELVAEICAGALARLRAEEQSSRLRGDLAHVTRVATMGELTASIAHEVSQPLSAILMNARACLRWLAQASPDPAEVREALDDIVANGERASNVITRTRALIKQGDANRSSLEINKIILQAVHFLAHEVLKREVSVKTELADGLPPVWGDPVQMQQVVLNLALNGIEAMDTVPAGSRELLIRSSREEAGGVLVSVQDRGIGLKPEDLERIFKAFFTTKPNGLGMGLSITRSIIESHGGRLWATLNDGPGATFHFSLPASPGETSHHRRQSSEPGGECEARERDGVSHELTSRSTEAVQ
jgi:signal transduction histidine kinase